MPVSVLYPKVSLEMSVGTISRWLVEEGAIVSAGQVLFEIENDKAAVEVEAPAAGILRGLVAEGVQVEVGNPVARILVGEEQDAAPRPVAADGSRETRYPAIAEPETMAANPIGSGRTRPNPTPLARRLARENGISLTGVSGTGPRGRVQRSDVMAEMERLAAAPTQPKIPSPALVSGPQATARLHGIWLRRGQGVPVVFLHGFSGDLNNWRGLLAGARPDWPAFALDLPGHGASPQAIPGDIDAVAACVEATLATEGVGSCVLVGHSFGGAVAARIASRRGVDVRGLCLFAPAGLHPQIDRDFIGGVLRAKQPQSLRPWLEHLVQDPRVISTAFVQAVVKAREDEDLTAAMGAFAATFFPDGTQAFQIREDLAGLEQPVRVIFGREDRVLPFASTRGLPGNVALHGLPNCGHMPHLEHPALALRLVSELWRSAV